MRSNIKIKLSVAGVILLGAFGYLAFAGMQKGWVYFVGVDRFMGDQQYATSQARIRLHGKVATEGFDSSAAALSAKFNLAGAAHQLPVVYRGAIPDMFQAGRDVVVEGHRDDAGVFQADVLMTKCASKYEPGSPHAAKAEKQS